MTTTMFTNAEKLNIVENTKVDLSLCIDCLGQFMFDTRFLNDYFIIVKELNIKVIEWGDSSYDLAMYLTHMTERYLDNMFDEHMGFRGRKLSEMCHQYCYRLLQEVLKKSE